MTRSCKVDLQLAGCRAIVRPVGTADCRQL